MIAKPFIKWVGGKTQLLPAISSRYPDELGSSIDTYIEPFVGKGAVLFDILNRYELREIIINDANSALINTYLQIRDNLELLLLNLRILDLEYSVARVPQVYYNLKREEYNAILGSSTSNARSLYAALFIFLNKTCFNGLYRVNRSGNFNVPMGKYVNPKIYDETNLRLVSEKLQGVRIMDREYTSTLRYITDSSFVYIDPPYRPLNRTSNFTAYTPLSFDDDDQEALAEYMCIASDRGAKVLLSNSDPKNTNPEDDFFDDLYSEFNIERIQARRVINCNGDSRGPINELLIKNY